MLGELALESDRQALLELRWYNLPSTKTDSAVVSPLVPILEALQVLSVSGEGGLLAGDFDGPKPKKLVGKATIVRLCGTLLRTVTGFCGFCRACISAKKSPYEALAEYCKRVSFVLV